MNKHIVMAVVLPLGGAIVGFIGGRYFTEFTFGVIDPILLLTLAGLVLQLKLSYDNSYRLKKEYHEKFDREIETDIKELSDK